MCVDIISIPRARLLVNMVTGWASWNGGAQEGMRLSFLSFGKDVQALFVDTSR